MIRIQYFSEEELENLISTHTDKGLYVGGYESLIEGDFVVFLTKLEYEDMVKQHNDSILDIEESEDKKIIKEIEVLKEQDFNLMIAAAETYEEMTMKNLELEDKCSNLEAETMALMIASVEAYEAQYIENMNMMLAIAELYELSLK